MKAATTILCAALLAGLGRPASAADPGLSVQGKRTYTSYCARCHGLNLVNQGASFDLRTFPADAKPRFLLSVSKGQRAMPAWETTLKPEDYDALWAYIGSVNGWPDAR